MQFFSPVEPGDLRRQGMPLSYISATARAIDGAAHRVSLYFDISGEWSYGDTNAEISWDESTIGTRAAGLISLSQTPATPRALAEESDTASWGTTTWSTAKRAGLTFQIGEDQVVRTQATSNGVLTNSVDANKPRAISDHWPAFAFNLDLGTIRTAGTPFVISIGHVREPAVSYLGTPLPPLWKSYFASWQEMVAFFHRDFAAAAGRADKLDSMIDRDARAAGGVQYAGILALSLRQAFGGTELVSHNGKPWAFLKEISSDGNVSSIDVTYPCMPAFLYADPAYLALILEPMLDYAENGGWPKEFAEHDLGSHYPNADGHNDGNEEDMPVEESVNMLIMCTAYLQRADVKSAKAFATAHYPILKKWSDYLVANALDPDLQNQTDDFTGFIAHSVNLALKGILGIGAMEADKSGRTWTPLEVVKHRSIGGLGPVVVGSPETVADELERWMDVGGIDGFNIAYAITPGSFEDFIELVVPELQRRGRVQTDYTAGTFREKLLGATSPQVAVGHPARQYRGAFTDSENASANTRPSKTHQHLQSEAAGVSS